MQVKCLNNLQIINSIVPRRRDVLNITNTRQKTLIYHTLTKLHTFHSKARKILSLNIIIIYLTLPISRLKGKCNIYCLTFRCRHFSFFIYLYKLLVKTSHNLSYRVGAYMRWNTIRGHVWNKALVIQPIHNL